MSRKETEIEVRDTTEGVELLIGKKIIGTIREVNGNFDAFSSNEKRLGMFKKYNDAEEEVIRTYNLSL